MVAGQDRVPIFVLDDEVTVAMVIEGSVDVGSAERPVLCGPVI